MIRRWLDKLWIRSVIDGNVIPQPINPFYSSNGHIQGIGELRKGQAVILKTRTGNRGVFRVESSEVYSDFGETCYNASVKFMGYVIGKENDE